MAEEKKGWTRLVVPDCSLVSFGKILDLVLADDPYYRIWTLLITGVYTTQSSKEMVSEVRRAKNVRLEENDSKGIRIVVKKSDDTEMIVTLSRCDTTESEWVVDRLSTLRIEKYQTAIEEAIENISLDCPHDV